MSFGLCNAPATFQYMKDRMLGKRKGSKCLVYLDDVIVFGKTLKETMDNLGEVLKELQKSRKGGQPRWC